jgi:RimJ/RimL family protein N-acetyltransferase
VPALPLPSPPLADEVVALRAWRPEDVPANVMLFADPSVQRFCWPHVTPYTEQDAHRFFASQLADREAGREISVAFTDPVDPAAVLGGGSLYDVDVDRGTAAVGYWVTPSARGRGVATHATRLLARWAFDELLVARLELTCSPDNESSQRVAYRCGFVREGLLRSHLVFQGARRDTVLFSLLPHERR